MNLGRKYDDVCRSHHQTVDNHMYRLLTVHIGSYTLSRICCSRSSALCRFRPGVHQATATRWQSHRSRIGELYPSNNE